MAKKQVVLREVNKKKRVAWAKERKNWSVDAQWRKWIESNLDNSNADFSKLPDFSKTSDSPEIFLYCLMFIIPDFSNFDFSKNSVFRTILPVQIEEIPIKTPLEIRSRKLPIKVTHDEHDFFVEGDQLLQTRVNSQVYSLQLTDIGLTVTLLGVDIHKLSN